MTPRLLIVDGDGTVSSVTNPFFEVAKALSCIDEIGHYAQQYLSNRISYEELLEMQNPVFLRAGRKYVRGLGYSRLDPVLFSKLLRRVVGSRLVAGTMIAFLRRVREAGYAVAMISSGWDLVIGQAAKEAGIDYWKANEVWFVNNEFAGTKAYVKGDKRAEVIAAMRSFQVEAKHTAYIGDSKFDLPVMEFVYRNGGASILTPSEEARGPVGVPSYVLRFSSHAQMAGFLAQR